MALRGVVEVATHLVTFRNVDLFHQGLYHIRCRVVQEQANGETTVASPICTPAVAAAEEENGTPAKERDCHCLLPAAIDEEAAVFRSRSFLIRYCEEEVELDDVGQFRLEIPDIQQDLPLTLEIDLMWADLSPHGGTDSFTDNADGTNTVPLDEFKVQSVQKYQLHHVAKGIHAFCPVIFDEFHFCLTSMVVHVSLLDYRLRLRPLASPPFLPTGGGYSGSLSFQPQKAPAASFSEFLLQGGASDDQRGQENGETPSLISRADKIHADCLGKLTDAHADLAAFIKLLAERYLPSKARNAAGDDLAVVRALQLPNGSPCTPSARLGEQADASAIASLFVDDFSLLSAQLRDVWQRLMRIIKHAAPEIAGCLRANWELTMTKRWGDSIRQEVCTVTDLAVPKDRAIYETHNQLASTIRKSTEYQALEPYVVEDLSMTPPAEVHPIIFEQRYVEKGNDREEAASERPRGAHLFVLVHGFQGNSFDMRLMKNNIALQYPKAMFLMSNVNEENTEGDIMEMGQNLATELKGYIRDWCAGPALGRLSFVAHSIGGLIVRSALPLLDEYADKMFTFLTLSTPHLGYKYSSNSLFSTGLWVVKKVRKSKCLEQLCMTDAENPQETFLYRLSRTRCMAWFRHIALVSSYQDQYAPYESARIEISPEAEADPQMGRVVADLARGILEPLAMEKIVRYDVNFSIPETNLDTFIGRAAHIQFLECQPLMKMFIHTYSHLFK